jgi:anti-anti-sigma regulatory factor
MAVPSPLAAGSDPGGLPGPMMLSVTLPATPDVGWLVAGGVLDRDGLAALIHLALIGVRRGCREVVLDVRGLTDFPSALFAELRDLADVARRYRCRLRLEGLDAAVAAAVATTGRGESEPPRRA